MALDPYWPMDRQFTPDRGKPNPLGLPPAMYVAGNLDGTGLEFEADLDLHADPAELAAAGPQAQTAPSLTDVLQGRPVAQDRGCVRQVLFGIHLICPRCYSPLYVPSRDHPKPLTLPRAIHVHWDHLITSSKDGKRRPTFTIEGPIACDYLMSEVTGIPSPSGTRCGWVGVIERGRAYDHSRIKSPLRAHGQ